MTAITQQKERPRPQQQRPRPRRLILRLVQAALIVLVLVLLLPYLLVPLYRVVDPVSTLMLWRWATGGRVERTCVPIDAHGAGAAGHGRSSSEDGRFCSHRGVDFSELRDGIEDADDITEVRGGSTITQQTAKNLFLWPGRSFVRKALEFPLALWIDLVLPKRRVLEIYLNIAEWGPNGEFGAEAGRALRLRQVGAGPHRPRGGAAGRDAAQSASGAAPAARAGVRRLAGIYETRAAPPRRRWPRVSGRDIARISALALAEGVPL